MEKIDQILSNLYLKLDIVVNFLKKITSIKLMTKLNDLSKKVHATLIISSVALTFVFFLRYYFSGYDPFLAYAITAPVGIIILAYLSKDFHKACSNLISSNKTTLSNGAILTFNAILSLIAFFLLVLAGVAQLLSGEAITAFTFLLYALLLYMSAGTQFNPSLLNIEVTDNSSSGEDFVTIFSTYLKSFVYFEKIISAALIFVGVLTLLTTIFDSSKVFNMTWAFGLITSGVAFPILVYLAFTILWFFNSIILSILSIGKSR